MDETIERAEKISKDNSLSYKAILIFTFPSILSLAAEPLAQIIDNALVGRHNSTWLSGMAICTSVFASFTWLFNFLVHGVTARIGQAYGAHNQKSLEADFYLTFVMSIGLGIISAIILIFSRSAIFFNIMASDQTIFQVSESYYLWRAFGMPFAILLSSNIAILRGLQKIREALVVIIVTTLINACGSLSSLYIFSFGFAGIGAATTLSFLVGCLLSHYFITTGTQKIAFVIKRPDFSRVISFGKDAWYMGGRTASLLTCFFIATTLASRLGPNQLAAHQVLYQVWILASFLVDGIAITANSMGAPLLGAQKFESFTELCKKLINLGAIVGLAIAALYLCAGPFIYGIFTTDQTIIAFIRECWLLIGIFQVTNALVFVSDGILFAKRDFRYIRNWMILGALGLFLPISLISFNNSGGLLGIWAGLAALYILRMISNLHRFYMKSL